jgi:hypothetical protein
MFNDMEDYNWQIHLLLPFYVVFYLEMDKRKRLMEHTSLAIISAFDKFFFFLSTTIKQFTGNT